ncbi:MAG: glycosyltransferase family 2 protein [Deltaproteobacteria bacterium]|nr:glycosyltransferase family 2 protein [Deltaproteobacteria bacterium]
MNDKPIISVIIPAYNEEGAIGDVIVAIHELGLPATEILVINDGSTDSTSRIAEAAGARVINHPYNMGNGAAVKTGIRSARGKALVFMDADGQHAPQDLPRILSQLSKYHMVVGARQRDSETTFMRDVANFIYNRFASYAAKFKIEDLTSGMRAMRREDALRFCDLLPNTFSYPTTSTLAFIRSGRTLRYIPIKTKYRVGSSKINPFIDGPRFLLIIMKIATLFSPMRVFLPVSIMTFTLGLFWYAFTYVTQGRLTNMSALLFNTSVIIFMLGLIAEQIASMRLERTDNLSNYKPTDDYSDLAELDQSESAQA